jgi:signal transduction histidine kinase
LDKLIVFGLGAVAAAQEPFGSATVVTALAALLLAVACELLRPPSPVNLGLALAWCAACLVWPPLIAWAGLPTYDLARRAIPWTMPSLLVALVTVGRLSWSGWAMAVAVMVTAGVWAWRTQRTGSRLARYRGLRDQLSAQGHRLAQAQAASAERQELDVRLATADERARIAREIHDTTGHALTRSLLQVQALRVAEPALAPRLEPLAATLDEALDTLRASVHGLRDAALDLPARLEALADGTDLALTVEAPAEPLPPEVARCFLAVAQEAIANTLRHSDATATAIRVAILPGIYQLVVQDNGSGPSSSTENGGMGLQTMADRTKALGGIFRATREDGFRIFVSLPRPTSEEDCEDDDANTYRNRR